MAVSQYPYQTCLASHELRRRKIIHADLSDLCLFSIVSCCREICCGLQHLGDWELAALMISGLQAVVEEMMTGTASNNAPPPGTE